jgi:predicted Rossmann fold nucleotide-binding protein DprA/Smf involved in DNA uptake
LAIWFNFNDIKAIQLLNLNMKAYAFPGHVHSSQEQDYRKILLKGAELSEKANEILGSL